jgi:hypothetical protein
VGGGTRRVVCRDSQTTALTDRQHDGKEHRRAVVVRGVVRGVKCAEIAHAARTALSRGEEEDSLQRFYLDFCGGVVW